MITKETIKNEEVFAIDEPIGDECNECMFDLPHCGSVPCHLSQRTDRRSVYFRPTYDLKALAAYHAQEHRDVQ